MTAADEMIAAYPRTVEAVREFLLGGERSADEFDARFRSPTGQRLAPPDFIKLWDVTMVFQPDQYWALHLRTLQAMMEAGEVTGEMRNDMMHYRLTVSVTGNK